MAWIGVTTIMARGSTSLDNYEYDEWLAKHRKERELRLRKAERTNKGIRGWHWGLGEKPVKVGDKKEFKRELEKRGLMMKDDVRRRLR